MTLSEDGKRSCLLLAVTLMRKPPFYNPGKYSKMARGFTGTGKGQDIARVRRLQPLGAGRQIVSLNLSLAIGARLLYESDRHASVLARVSQRSGLGRGDRSCRHCRARDGLVCSHGQAQETSETPTPRTQKTRHQGEGSRANRLYPSAGPEPCADTG